MSKRYPNNRMVIPYGGEANVTVVFRQANTGHVLHATSGECTEAITFDEGKITASRHPESGDWRVDVPATDIKSLYGSLYVAAAGDVTKDSIPDTPNAIAFLFDTQHGMSFSDLVPTFNGRVRTD